MRLYDHAYIEYGVLSGIPRRSLAKVCQAAYSFGSRRRTQPSLRRSRASQKYSVALPAALLASNPKENLWDEIREKIFKNYALKSIDAVRAKLKQAILYIEHNPKTVQSIASFPYIAKSL